MLTMAHQTSTAIELYEKLLKVDSKRIDALLQLTFLHFNEGKLDIAEEYTNRILKIDNNHQIGTYNLGAIAATKGDNKKAKTIWEGLVKKFPKTEIAHIAEESLKHLNKINR